MFSPRTQIPDLANKLFFPVISFLCPLRRMYCISQYTLSLSLSLSPPVFRHDIDHYQHTTGDSASKTIRRVTHSSRGLRQDCTKASGIDELALGLSQRRGLWVFSSPPSLLCLRLGDYEAP